MESDAGKRMGRFLLGELLGRGGSGRVYAASDAETGRAVTVKVVAATGPDERERLSREAKVVAAIDSPHVMRPIEVVEREGEVGLVYPAVDGETVEALLREGPLPLVDALAVARAAARGLAATHERGVVHRDLKPANLLVPRCDGELVFAEAILMDFGALGELDAATLLTSPGMVVGTPAYMSPEQLSGSPHGPQTDVYGLAAVLYEMVSGRRPYEAKTTYDVMRSILSPAPAPPAPPGVPGALRDLLARALSKSMADRPRDAAAFLEELDRIAAPAARSFSLDRPRPPERDLVTGPPPRPVGKTADARPRLSPPRARRAIAPALVAAAALTAGGLGLALVRAPWGWLVFGLCLIAAGVAGGAAVHRHLSSRVSELSRRATDLLVGAESRDSLTESLAIRLDVLWRRCETSEQEIVWHTVAMMVREYRDARESGDRQSALMNLVALVGELQRRLSPWYVRHEKAVSFGVGLVGIASGATGTIIAIARALR